MDLRFMLKFLNFLLIFLKMHISSNPLMNLFYTFTDVRYWSKVLYTTAFTFFCDLEVKAIDLDI